ncbi:proline dehydrogenase family protein [Corynebacterium pygosceleis]|uniref:proline dehydrogenase family protein n=1 Tax=Corynebacterium pygosceleis TaxID=2800406 RepID=UPI001907786C|nr:proline dehydrogenase family protein [Corynebacterium pygosceleis]MCL0121310.1 proline dehydrogenase family protein [Corynebacterium pygosceleis]
MSLPHAPANTGDVEKVSSAAIERAETWLNATGSDESRKEAKSTEQLAALVHDTDGIDFTMGFVDRVARPEDNHVSARELANLASPLKGRGTVPDFVGPVDRGLVTAGSIVAPWLPGVVMPIARKRLRQMVGHLVLDAEGSALNKLLDRSREQGFRLNLNLLGEAVLGDREAESRLNRTLDLLDNPRVDYVSIKASSVCAQLNPWDIESNTERLKETLRPLYRRALSRDPHPFINLDMEEYKDLRLTIRLFTELLSEEEFLPLEAGIVLQAYLPDTLGALRELAEFAARRRAAGGAKIKIRLVKGANLSMERVEAEIHDWKQAPYLTKAEVDANYIRLLDWILQPEHADNVRIGVASHNLYAVALAHELAVERGVERQLDVEMLQGMAPSQARAVRDVVGDLILYTPVVHDEDFDVAVSYLVRRLEENGAKQNFLYALFAPEITGDDGLTPMQSQRQRFRSSVADRWSTAAGPRRTQDRAAEEAENAGTSSGSVPGHFIGEPDTDPSLPANREWAIEALNRDPGEVESERVTSVDTIDAAVDRAVSAGAAWGSRTGAERAELLDRAAEALANARGELITVMTHEAGKTVGEADPEVSEAIDFARYYAESARALDRVRGVRFEPYRVVVVTPPWNFPVAIPMGGVFAALAAGAAVIIKPAPQVVRCTEVAVAALRRAGIGEDLLQLVNADEDEAGKRLVSHPDVDSVILTGASETAKLFRSWKPRMVINAETSGKNAIIVTPSADPDLAVADVYRSAFGHAGQKCSAASLVILVGSVGKSRRFLNQLVDAVESLHVGYGTDISTTMNNLIEPPGEKLERGLTQLDDGERWLVKPRQLDDSGRLWLPGLRDGVEPGSWFHTHECFGPVLGIMRAESLEEAVEWQNSTGFALTGGLHSLDTDEIAYWREHVEVGNAYINRGITGAIVERQSFGGWKNSSLGSGAKAGGPNYIGQQGTWSEGDLNELHAGSVATPVAQMLREFKAQLGPTLTPADNHWLRRAAEADAYAWQTEFGVEHDRTALLSESNVFRYRPLLQPLRVRIGNGTPVRDLLRMKLASRITGTDIDVSATAATAAELGALGAGIRAVSDGDFATEIASARSVRVRALGEVPENLYRAAAESGSVILDQPVLADGRRELLPFLLEQAISTTEHRFGYIRGLSN